MADEWRPYPPAPDSYLASESGAIYSVPRVIERSNGIPQRVGGKVMKPLPDHHGHLWYKLRINKEHHAVSAHAAVMDAFVGPRPEGAHICHWDDDPANNHVSNLRYGTASDNMNDRVRNNIHHNANRTHCRMGHEYTPENTRYRETKVCRDCLACEAMKIRLRSVYRAQIRHKKKMFKIADKLSGFVAVSKKWASDE